MASMILIFIIYAIRDIFALDSVYYISEKIINFMIFLAPGNKCIYFVNIYKNAIDKIF